MTNLVQLFPYLIGFDPTNPTDNSIVSQFPSNERDSRSALVSAWAIEHDNVDGRHSFGIGNTAARDAITTWTSGAIWVNTSAGTGNTVLQTVVSVTASVPGWDETGRFTSADEVLLDTIDSSAQANVSIATSAEAVAGTDNVNTMTSLRTKTAIDANAPAAINMEVFTADGTWTQPSGVTELIVECVGGGGAGGGTDGAADEGGGGGGGAYIRADVTVSGNITVTVGAGGIGAHTTGPNGADTTFGTLVTAKGGSGGVGIVDQGAGGAGGLYSTTVTTGTLIEKREGANGQPGVDADGGGHGGQNGLVGGTSLNGGAQGANPGTIGIGLGSGGGGADGDNGGTDGGDGTDGYVIVMW